MGGYTSICNITLLPFFTVGIELSPEFKRAHGCLARDYVFQSCSGCIVMWLNSCQGSVQFSSLTQSCLTLCDPMNHSTPSLPVHHQLPESIQTHVHQVGDAMQAAHPLLSPSPALNLSQHQGLFQWVSSSHQVAKVMQFQLQHQSFQWTPRTDLL